MSHMPALGLMCGHLSAAVATWILEYQRKTENFDSKSILGMPIFDRHITAFGRVEESFINASIMKSKIDRNGKIIAIFSTNDHEIPSLLESYPIEDRHLLLDIFVSCLKFIEEYALLDFVIEGAEGFSPHWRADPPEFGPSGWFDVRPALLPAMRAAVVCEFAEYQSATFRWVGDVSRLLNLEETNEIRRILGRDPI